MKTIDVNITPAVISQNVQLISKIGSNLGTQFCKVDVRMAWAGGQDGFERDKAAIETGEKKGFILNRSPRRFCMKSFLVAGTILTKDPVSDEMGIAVNPHEDGSCDLFLPINESTLKRMGKTTREAIAEAIKGEKDHFFLDAKSLATVLNEAISHEISNLEDIITKCQKMVNTLKGDKVDNENKAKLINDAWINSAIKPDVELPAGPAYVTVETKED